ncbi:MAG: DUF4256 domain-containing protein [Oscillospiraceae bacterium]|nr:DUF4256 domain-containing protein [Oscillospiraceae bacterium]
MLTILKNRFDRNRDLHPDLSWEQVEQRLQDNEAALAVLRRMEDSGGEPDTLGFLPGSDRLLFCDCAKETPVGRRSLCYDEEARARRTKNPPAGSACRQAAEMGVALMTEELYYRLQERGEFDIKTSSWIDTPEELRRQGGALFCERRYGRVFTFHNGADSYYAVRGWRGMLIV